MLDMTSWIVSVDDHVVEPPNVWQDRLPQKHREAGPKIVRDDAGEFWVYEGKRFPMDRIELAAGSALDASTVAREGKGTGKFETIATSFAEMRPGYFEPLARVEDMNRDHVLASMLFPSFPRFCGQTFNEGVDRELALLCVQAYNDWMLDEWAAAAPGRFIPCIILPLWDPRAGAIEIERCAAKGARAFAFSENPTHLGLPSIHDRFRYWDPVFKAANDTEMVVAIHLGSSSYLARTSSDSPEIVPASWHAGVTASGAMLDFLFSGHLVRCPNLKVLLAEGGIGWMPYFLSQADHYARKYPSMTPDGYPHDIDIEEEFSRHIFGCLIVTDGKVVNAAASDIMRVGENNVMIESDYPHSASSWPNSAQNAAKYLKELSDDARAKVMRENACRLFRFDPTPPEAGSP